jgi:uncharacterized protein (DUF2062 family)
MSFKSKYKERVINPVIGYLKEGAKPQKLSLAIVLGFTLGIIPFLGVNTAICFLLAIVLRLNVVVIQLINYIAFPLQLLLIVPFFKAGEAIFGTSNEKIALTTFSNLIGEHWMESVVLILKSNMKALMVWMIIALPFSFFAYYFIRNGLRKWAVKGE